PGRRRTGPFGGDAPGTNGPRGGRVATDHDHGSPAGSFPDRLFRSLSPATIPTWIRYVLVPGWTDAPEAVAGLARFVAGLGNVDRVDVLPFHMLGASKYEALGIPFPLRDTPVPEPGLTERVREQFRECGLAAY
ncbi:hypothetical protein ACFWAN_34150, partial [Streptomyces mirabilis]